jgi:membrane protease YdiL (CAAX protease family)
MKMRTEGQIARGGAERESTVDGPPSESLSEQYSLAKILGIWAAAALPMALLAWVIAPVIIPHLPLHSGITYWLLIIAGMSWQFVVALFILRRELGNLRWDVLRKRLWLNLPRDPHTGRARARLFWWVVPCLMFTFTIGIVLARYLDAPVTALFPALQMPARADQSRLADPQFIGQWWLLGVLLISWVFNYFLGEELLFRGVLLPKMRGVFGRWDWVANAVLFGLYHLHMPWSLPSNILANLAYTWPARRFRSNWMSVIVHGVEGLIVLPIVLSVILGLGV